MSERREKSSRKKKVSSSLEQLSKSKKGKQESVLDQYEVEEVDETVLTGKPTGTKKNKKRKKRNDEIEKSKPIPSIFLNQKKNTSSPPNKKMKPQQDSYLTNIMSELGDDDEEEEEEKDFMITEEKPEIETTNQFDSEDEEEVDSPPPKPKTEKLKQVSKPIIPTSKPTSKPLIPVTKPLIPVTKKNEKKEANLNQKFRMPSSSTLKTKKVEEVSLSSNFQMYLIDAYEERNQNDGTIYLFGKIQLENEFKSCCVVVKNLERNIFLLPRDKHLNDENEEVTEDDMDDEIERIMKEQKIKTYKHKMTKRNYAFEKEGVPHGNNNFIKLVYPGTSPILQFDEKTNNIFSHLFGQNTSRLELFLIKRKIKGPCWIEIKNSKEPKVNVSWCHSEAICENPKDIQVLKEQLTTPNLKLMTIKTRTVMNEKTNSNEIIMISGLCHSNVTIDSNCETDKNLSKFTLMKRLETSGSIPKLNDNIIEVFKTESDLIEAFIEKIYSFDPDVLVGHNFLSFDLDIFLHRMNSKKISNWSKLGRLKRKQIPKLQNGPGGTSTSTFQEQLVLSGRLVCDTYISSKDYLRESNYSLKSLAKSQLKNEQDIIVINNDLSSIQPYFKNEKSIIMLARNNEYFTYLSMMLMFKLTLLPLTKELANAAGNLWSKTLIGNSSERIEYLLLHEFHSKKFIVPDKDFFKKNKENTKNTTKKKADYAGGLVIQPQKGLYDTYVLLLDFNSLYPSIILEKNLCFTTVVRNKQQQQEGGGGEEKDILLNEIKESDDVVLPKVIKSLLERRKNVKNLMKNEKDDSKKWQLNIKQNALKLIANSTYGCLGFPFSRFYCKTIAEMITAFGRDNLSRTKSEIEDKLGHKIIYGDTDSVMVLTPFTDFKKANVLGNEIIKYINKQHEHLQLGIDGLFRKMLLLEKKRYVAILHVENKNEEIGYSTKVEIKGIEMIRRDWCDLTKDVSQMIIDQILGDTSNEQVVNSIHEYLRNLSKNIENISIEKFILSKELSKDPKDYPDAKQLPHVMVAKRMIENGQPVAVKQRIQYLVCNKKQKEGEEEISKLSLSERAYHIDEFYKNQDDLEIDYQWYLSAQIHPPTVRLCKYIEGTNSSLLAECLGLDNIILNQYSSGNNGESFDWIEDEEEKYKNVQLKHDLLCNYCQEKIELNLNERILKTLKYEKEEGMNSIGQFSFLECSNCNKKCSSGRISNWIVKNIRSIQELYYKNNLTSNNGTTTTISIKNDHCYISGSLQSINSNEITSSDLYLHLNYFYHLFDYESIFEKLVEQEKNSKEELSQIMTQLKSSGEIKDVEKLKKKSEFYLEKCGFRYINTTNLFNIFNLLENKD
eukprot:gene7748-12218_t